MSAIVFVTGPCHVFVTSPTGDGINSGVLAYLGTCEDTPRCVLRPASEPVMNALAGTKIPFDKADASEEAFIGLDLTRFDQGVLNAIRARSIVSNRAAVALNQGRRKPGDIGTLAITENAVFDVYLVFPYATKPAFALQGMPGQYHFGYCTPAGEGEDIGPLSTRARKEHVLFHAIPGYDPATGELTLYDNLNITAFPPIN